MAENEKLEFKVVMDDPPDTEVLARVSHLEFGFAVFTAAIAKHPNRNIDLRHGARVIRRHQPNPPSPIEPIDFSQPLWRVIILRGSKGDDRGTVRAKDEAAAREAAIKRFKLNEFEQKRLAVRRQPIREEQ